MTMNEILEFVAAHRPSVSYVDVLNADPEQKAALDNKLRVQALIADGLLSGNTKAYSRLAITPAGQKQLDKIRKKRRKALERAEEAARKAEEAKRESDRTFVVSVIAVVVSVVAIVIQALPTTIV